MELEDTPMTFCDPIWQTDDTIRIQMEKKSIIRPVKCGVPQGSVLGPLFLILYMNDIVNTVNANNIRLYADDTCVFMHNKNIQIWLNKQKPLLGSYKNGSCVTN